MTTDDTSPRFARTLREPYCGSIHVITDEKIKRTLVDRRRSTIRKEARDWKGDGLAASCGIVLWAPWITLTRDDVYHPDSGMLCGRCRRRNGLPYQIDVCRQHYGIPQWTHPWDKPELPAWAEAIKRRIEAEALNATILPFPTEVVL